MFDWISNFMQGKMCYKAGTDVWNAFMTLIGATAAQTPKTFSSAAWNYVVNILMTYTLTIAGSLVNIFFMVSTIRQCSNLKENLTLEIIIEKLIMVCLANSLLLNSTEIMSLFFNIASVFSGGILTDSPLIIAPRDWDVGTGMFYWLFGTFFFGTCLVCGMMIFLAVYRRYIDLYLLVATGPIAWSTMPGGPGIASTASSWVRTFLAKTFEIVIIAMILGISGILCESIDFGTFSGIASWFDGAVQALQGMVTMVLGTAAVIGTDMFMRRSFGL